MIRFLCSTAIGMVSLLTPLDSDAQDRLAMFSLAGLIPTSPGETDSTALPSPDPREFTETPDLPVFSSQDEHHGRLGLSYDAAREPLPGDVSARAPARTLRFGAADAPSQLREAEDRLIDGELGPVAMRTTVDFDFMGSAAGRTAAAGRGDPIADRYGDPAPEEPPGPDLSDLGEFSLGEKVTWQIADGLHFVFGDRLTAQLGYRTRSLSKGLGLKGPVLGLTYRF